MKDLEKLSKLCLWVRIPHSYRSTVWKVLLGKEIIFDESPINYIPFHIYINYIFYIIIIK